MQARLQNTPAVTVRQRPVRYVCMPGAGFSGTTLLAFLLNSHSDCVSVGEATGLISRVALSDYQCSCGERFIQCAFWTRVSNRLREIGWPMDLYRTNFWDTHFRVTGYRYLDAALIRSLRNDALTDFRDAVVTRLPLIRDRLSRTAEVNRAFAQAITHVSGKSIFIDSSKDHVRPKLLARSPDLDVWAIHLVRDARANTASIMRHHGITDVRQAAHIWWRTNLEADRAWRRLPPERRLRVRYDDLCSTPQQTLDRIFRFLGVAPMRLPQNFRSVEHHIIGNSMRLSKSSAIRLDTSWKCQLTPSQLATIARISGQLNRHFGFDWP